ncbi:anti-sigma-I factor RsgI family protein [Acetivibrio cellulolyticus]|uniref:anti-sigma-I factor RsgI family protein n=1 Tax=Acetivibrio cellulolyticus TaxID=35830 RepID=UPI0001E2D094|nr:anti-sigma factor domain-containing protein [Acetivibrio cellulolyticus]
MIRLGIVYEVHSNKAVVLTPDSEFLVIKRTRDMYVGQQVKFNIQDVRKTTKPIYKYASIASSIAAVFIMVFMFSRVSLYDNSYGYINVDVNPSIGFSVNKEFEVLKIKAINDDAGDIVKELDAEGKNVYTVITEFVDKSEARGFINPEGNNVILVSASVNNKNKEYSKNSHTEKKLETFLRDLNRKMNGENEKYITSKVIQVTPEERREAEKNDLSMGKYYLLEKAKECGVDLSLEEIKTEKLNTKKISELFAAIDTTNGVIITSDAAMSLQQKDVVNTAKPGNEPTKAAGTINTPAAQATKPLAKPTTSPKPVVSKPTATGKNVVKPTATAISGNYATGSLKLQLYSVQKQVDSQIISSKIRIINSGKADIDLAKVKVRYYFTKEDSASKKGKSSKLISLVYDYGKGSMSNLNFYRQENQKDVVISFHELSGSEMYMEIKFNSGTLKKGEYAYILSAVNKEDWGKFDQSNDYSFLAKGYNFQDSKNITAYISDSLVWGAEP